MVVNYFIIALTWKIYETSVIYTYEPPVGSLSPRAGCGSSAFPSSAAAFFPEYAESTVHSRSGIAARLMTSSGCSLCEDHCLWSCQAACAKDSSVLITTVSWRCAPYLVSSIGETSHRVWVSLLTTIRQQPRRAAVWAGWQGRWFVVGGR